MGCAVVYFLRLIITGLYLLKRKIGWDEAAIVISHDRYLLDRIPDRIVEVDLPGLTSPMLNRFAWTRLPRPVIPLDDGVEFRLT